MAINNNLYGNYNDMHRWNPAKAIPAVNFIGTTDPDKALKNNAEYEIKEQGN